MKVVADDKIPFIRDGLETLADEVVYLPGAEITNEDVRDADALVVRTRTRCDSRLLSGSSVRLIITATIGFDHIDTLYCESHGIRWTNCPGCNAMSVCTYVKNALIHLGLWRRGLTLGIVGVGHVGSLVAKAAMGQGMTVLLNDPPKHDQGIFFGETGYCSLEEIARKADIITFHTPLTKEGRYPTYHLADSLFLDSLRKKPVIINASRGGVVDEQALLAAYDRGQVSGMIIDTWEAEPDINLSLLRKAAISTPHIAGYSANGKMNASMMALNYIIETFQLEKKYFPVGQKIRGELLTPETLCDDSEKLKSNPKLFEWFRGHYPVRVEECV